MTRVFDTSSKNLSAILRSVFSNISYIIRAIKIFMVGCNVKGVKESNVSNIFHLLLHKKLPSFRMYRDFTVASYVCKVVYNL